MAQPAPPANMAPPPAPGGEPEKKDEDEAKPHPTLGYNAPRECRDIICGWTFLIIGIALIVATASTAFSLGEPLRLLYGQDSLGNLCGEPDQPNVPSTVTDWNKRLFLWYPLTFDFKQKKLLVTEAMKLGVCVDACPPPTSLVKPYHPPDEEAPPPWLVLFNSTPDLNFRRCIPEIFTFDCQSDEDCMKFILASNETFTAALALGNFANAALEEVRKYSWVIWIGIGVGVVLCFLWLVLVRFLLKPIIVITLVLLLLLFIGVGYMFFQMRTDELAKEKPNEETARWYLGFSICGWSLTLIFLAIMFFYGKSLMLAIDVIEEASRVPVDIPTLIFVPPVGMFFTIGFAAFAIVLAIFIQSTGENISLTVPVPNFLNISDNKTKALSNTSEYQNVTFGGNLKVREMEFPNWRPYAHIYNLFFFLWMFGLQNAICFMVIALCTTFWYFSNPGDDKKPPLGAVARAWWITMRYHLGTLAFGSMLIAIIDTVRFVLVMMEKKMAEADELGDATKCMFKMAQCCLACVKKCVDFINKAAYCVAAINGDGFFSAAKAGLEKLGNNILTVGMITVISSYVILFGKLCVTCSTIILSYLIMTGAGANDGVTGGVLLLFIIAILTFLIVSLFANIFSTCIDTMLMCYCWDKDEHGGYWPDDLDAYVTKISTAKKGSVDKGPDGSKQAEQAEPLKPVDL